MIILSFGICFLLAQKKFCSNTDRNTVVWPSRFRYERTLFFVSPINSNSSEWCCSYQLSEEGRSVNNCVFAVINFTLRKCALKQSSFRINISPYKLHLFYPPGSLYNYHLWLPLTSIFGSYKSPFNDIGVIDSLEKRV